ncbi:MAG: phage portal protein [Intestinimonas sp.]
MAGRRAERAGRLPPGLLPRPSTPGGRPGGWSGPNTGPGTACGGSSAPTAAGGSAPTGSPSPTSPWGPGLQLEQGPLVWLRYNEEELPLCRYVRDLIDDYNWQTSVTADALRDVAKFVYILKNYGGADLDEFVRDLRQCLAVKVEGDGGVDKLQTDLDVSAVLAFLERERRDLFDFASAVDTRDPDLGSASGTALGFRYMDLDADCADLADELQAAFRRLKPFLDTWLQATGRGTSPARRSAWISIWICR